MEEQIKSIHNPFAEVVGFSVTEVGEGASRTELEVAESHYNPNRVVHGGVIFAMADNCMGAALSTQLEPGQGCSTIEIKINFIRPVSQGRLVCETRVVHKGRSTRNGGKSAETVNLHPKTTRTGIHGRIRRDRAGGGWAFTHAVIPKGLGPFGCRRPYHHKPAKGG